MSTLRLPAMTPARLCGLCLPLLALLAWYSLHDVNGYQPGLLWRTLGVTAAPTGGDISAILVLYSWLPRFAVALLGGAGLALAGMLLQQTLRNPLASPTTLGVASGAQLGLLLATLYAPSLLLLSRGGVAFVGGAIAVAIVFALSWRQRLAPTVLVLAGMVVNLYLGTLSVALILMNQEALHGMMIWGAGSLVQDNWNGVLYLLPRLGAAGAGALLLMRALAVLDLGEVNARALGISLPWLRAASLGLAVFTTACVVSLLGMIGFIGLAAPAIVRLAGARTLKARLCWSTLLGALLLAIADHALQLLAAHSAILIPTGAATAALGAPLLIWLIPRLAMGRRSPQTAHAAPLPRRQAPRRFIALLALATVALAMGALWVGQGMDGWTWPWNSSWVDTGAWRLPRILAAAAAGMMLALAGTIIQRVSGNPMASPEILGISAGAGLGLLGVMLFVPGAGTSLALGAGTLGAIVTLLLLLVANARSGFDPEQLLLTGISIMFLFTAVLQIVLAGGDPRLQGVLAWMSGSTYHVDLHTALLVLAMAVLLFVAARPFASWLDLLPLGAASARALGMNITYSRLLLLLLVALLTAAATLIVGPLSFVGLLAPHMARLLGLARAREHMAGAVVIGAVLMILADWVGRQVMFPTELPAGMVATLIGGSYFMWRMRRL